MGKIREYEGEDITVQYDVARCIHAAECVQGLPQVFNPKARPWVDPEGDRADAIAEVIARCPSGALQYVRKDAGPPEVGPVEGGIRVTRRGPLYVSGRVRVEDHDGQVIVEDTRVALCRCGASANKPFCDGSHNEVGFRG